MDLSSQALERMSGYVELIVRWNAKLNLTSLRTPSEIIRRHLVECGFAAQKLPDDIASLMDYGSGAGLPGVVIAICRPGLLVTLAEAQGKKASFLREVNRTLGLECEIYDGRVEGLAPERMFDAVAMRAVEKTELAIPVAIRHLRRYLVLLTTEELSRAYQERFRQLVWMPWVRLPNSESTVLSVGCTAWISSTPATY